MPFGFGTNILVNMLVLTGLLRFVLKMPDSLVWPHPARARADDVPVHDVLRPSPIGAQTGRTDVCALPSGVSVPHMFVVTFVIMLPITIKTGDPIKGWQAGLVWVFFQSFILMIGFVAPAAGSRARRCSALPASRSPSSRCGRRWKCS
jgi:AGZA family xanthine/uracil permease-like MFS transporter